MTTAEARNLTPGDPVIQRKPDRIYTGYVIYNQCGYIGIKWDKRGSQQIDYEEMGPIERVNEKTL